jgi:hypothetical protein
MWSYHQIAEFDHATLLQEARMVTGQAAAIRSLAVSGTMADFSNLSLKVTFTVCKVSLLYMADYARPVRSFRSKVKE